MNTHCYQYELIQYSDGILSNSVDATYIIHLENNGRIEHIREQLNTYHPTNTVYIVFNKGFRNCSKQLDEQQPPYDLIDAFYNVFRHSREHNYKNILILEDDFEFIIDFNNKNVGQSINDFINSNTHSYAYYLGCIPYLRSFSINDHCRMVLSSGSHACIYSDTFCNTIVRQPRTSIYDWDIFMNKSILQFPRYAYYKPLCCQLCTETDNSKYWYNPFMLANLKVYLERDLLHMDKRFEPGYSFLYLFSLIMFFTLSFSLLVLLLFTYRLFTHKNKSKSELLRTFKLFRR